MAELSGLQKEMEKVIQTHHKATWELYEKHDQIKTSTDEKNVQAEYTRDMVKSQNNNFITCHNDAFEDYKYKLTDCSTLSKAYLHPDETIKTDTQQPYLTNALTTAIPNLANSGIVLITTKLNQSDENKLIHYNISSCGKMATLNTTNLETFNSDKVVTRQITALTSLKQFTIGSSEQQRKTATILVSKSKTKTAQKHFCSKNPSSKF